MPAYAKLASVVAMSLALVGAGTAIAQSVRAPANHAAYVEIVDEPETVNPDALTGQVACEVPLHEEVARQALDRPVCPTSEHAYAYPADRPAPWQGDLAEIESGTYVEGGQVWRVAEITYRTPSQDASGHETVHAVASELLPREGDGERLSYALPVDGQLFDEAGGDLSVEVGPAPGDLAR